MNKSKVEVINKIAERKGVADFCNLAAQEFFVRHEVCGRYLYVKVDSKTAYCIESGRVHHADHFKSGVRRVDVQITLLGFSDER